MSVLTSAPACLWVPPGAAGTYGEDVAEVAELIGRPLVPAQRLAVDALMSHDRRGRLLTVEAGVELPRQNGKTGAILLPIVLWSILTKPDNIVWTSHLLDSSAKSFHELAGKRPDDADGLIVSCDWLRRRVRAPSYENAQEGVTFINGGQLDFRARSARRGRGPSYSTVVFDEWLFGEAEQAAAVLPALATRSIAGSARALYASSAAMQSSRHLRGLRRRALAGDRTLTWAAWWSRGSWDDPGCELAECEHDKDDPPPGCQLDNPDRWLESNPLLDVLTSRDFLASMRKTMEPRQFAREFMGWQETGDEAVALDQWARLTDPRSRPRPYPAVIGFDVDRDMRGASVVMVGKREDGLVHVELRAKRPGVAWLREFLLDLQGRTDAVVCHLAGQHPVAGVLLDLDGVRLEAVSATHYAGACQAMQGLIAGGGLRHRGDAVLTSSLAAADRRDVGDGAWVLSRRSSTGDITAAVAMACALRVLAGIPDYAVSDSFY